MYPNFKLVRNLANLIFSPSKHAILPPKMSATSRGQIHKYVEEGYAGM